MGYDHGCGNPTMAGARGYRIPKSVGDVKQGNELSVNTAANRRNTSLPFAPFAQERINWSAFGGDKA